MLHRYFLGLYNVPQIVVNNYPERIAQTKFDQF